MQRGQPYRTVADLLACVGDIPLERIVFDPFPGTAVEDDVVRLDDHEDRLCELVDGVLIQKTAGFYESYLATEIAVYLGNCVERDNLGVVVGTSCPLRLWPGLIRMPDAAFFSFDRLPGGRVPQVQIADFMPDLAVEVLSDGNSPAEMQRKLVEYFAAGVRLVWYVDPRRREVRVYSSPRDSSLLTEDQDLDGGDVLPGLKIPLKPFLNPPNRAG
jgi:Uma2 family endonuclease